MIKTTRVPVMFITGDEKTLQTLKERLGLITAKLCPVLDAVTLYGWHIMGNTKAGKLLQDYYAPPLPLETPVPNKVVAKAVIEYLYDFEKRDQVPPLVFMLGLPLNRRQYDLLKQRSLNSQLFHVRGSDSAKTNGHFLDINIRESDRFQICSDEYSSIILEKMISFAATKPEIKEKLLSNINDAILAAPVQIRGGVRYIPDQSNTWTTRTSSVHEAHIAHVMNPGSIGKVLSAKATANSP